jgi:uroporphyrin-3 C-methyltransferase
MSDQSDKRQSDSTKDTLPRRSAKERSAPAGRGALLLSLVCLLTTAALLAAAGWGWFWLDEKLERIQALEAVQSEQAETLSTLDERTGRIDAMADQLAGMDRSVSEVAEANARLLEQVGRLDERTEALRAFVDAGRSAWRVAEVEYLLRLASSELQIAHRPETAMAALEAADARLAALADPALVPVREALAADMERLRAVERPDIAGMALTLSSLIDRVDALPIGRERLEQPAATDAGVEDAGFWQRLRDRGAGVLREMVTIRHQDMPIRPLLAPEQEYFLRRNLALKLETARLALLRGQPETWRASLDEARRWLTTWYDTGDSAVNAMDESLARLTERPVRAERPDISSALQRLRGIREARD